MSYRDVPGIDCAYLAMDTEEGVEVVWNEATFSETKKFKVIFSHYVYFLMFVTLRSVVQSSWFQRFGGFSQRYKKSG